MSEIKREKRYVPVIVRFDTEGQLWPLEIEFDEKHKYAVDRVLDRLPDRGRRGCALYGAGAGEGAVPVAGKGPLVR